MIRTFAMPLAKPIATSESSACEGVDEYSGDSGPPSFQAYRGADDQIGTEPSGDYSRPDQFAAGRVDYCINPFVGNSGYNSAAEWVNYTRNWPASTNWIIGRFANGASSAGSIEMTVVIPASPPMSWAPSR